MPPSAGWRGAAARASGESDGRGRPGADRQETASGQMSGLQAVPCTSKQLSGTVFWREASPLCLRTASQLRVAGTKGTGVGPSSVAARDRHRRLRRSLRQQNSGRSCGRRPLPEQQQQAADSSGPESPRPPVTNAEWGHYTRRRIRQGCGLLAGLGILQPHPHPAPHV